MKKIRKTQIPPPKKGSQTNKKTQSQANRKPQNHFKQAYNYLLSSSVSMMLTTLILLFQYFCGCDV